MLLVLLGGKAQVPAQSPCSFRISVRCYLDLYARPEISRDCGSACRRLPAAKIEFVICVFRDITKEPDRMDSYDRTDRELNSVMMSPTAREQLRRRIRLSSLDCSKRALPLFVLQDQASCLQATREARTRQRMDPI